LNNSDNTLLHEETITVPGGGTGIWIRNGSGGTLVRGLQIGASGPDAIGIHISDPGSDMQFDGNTSSFDGSLAFYFVLDNSAMVGETLDASQQFFDGVRASDFTLAQLVAAEAKTIDDENRIIVGDVFYKAFSDFFDEFLQQNRASLFRKGLFSFAGHTITNDLNETPFSFAVGKIDLSLLGSGAPKANFSNFTPGQFGNLSPAAGGDASKLANLEPAAGPGGDCGNSFLGNGFAVGYSSGSCSVQ
jgi:hypothetical protein